MMKGKGTDTTTRKGSCQTEVTRKEVTWLENADHQKRKRGRKNVNKKGEEIEKQSLGR